MYRPVPKIPDFPELERRMLALWRDADVFRKLRDKNAGKPSWSFLDGPITANNPMGVHHAWGRSYKDMFQRYHAMNGRELRYQNGFDCQGLWVEVEVEKELGFESKADIARYGIDAFVRRCKERVLTFAARQTEQSIRLGYWMDWDDPDVLRALRDALRDDAREVAVTMPSGRAVTGSPEQLIANLGCPEYGGSYFTFSTENNYTIWRFLKKCHDEGFVYRGTDVMPWCTRCGTGLSQMEVAEGRKITAHTSVFVRFPLRDGGGGHGGAQEALLVWTTTPWTLTSNVAAAVNPELPYLKVRCGDWIYYVGKGAYSGQRVQELEAAGKREVHKLHTVESLLKGQGAVEVLGEVTGAQLVGRAYDGPFDHLPAQSRPGGLTPLGRAGRDHGVEDGEALTAIACHRVIAWDEVSEAEGTGIVHIAPGCGAEDHRLGRDHGLVAIAPLDEGGRYVDGFGELTGRHVLEVTDDIATDLRQRGVLVAKERYPHVYPHCWRCKQELVFRLVDEWFIRMDWRDRIQRIVPDVRWIPPDGEAREQDWLANMGDWMISKKRFWGLALPIWVCGDCDAFEVIGGHDELRERAVAGWDAFEGHTPHRPWIDAVEIACRACGGRARRIEDVGNPWLDAGIVPFSTVHYNTDRAYWQRWFPADFVVECFPGQFRNWFYALLAMSAMLEERAPFRVLLGHALVRDARGHEMHKSAGNAIAFDEAAEELGAEVMRYLYAAHSSVQNLNFPDLPSRAKSPGDAGGKRAAGGTLDAEVRGRLLTLWNCYSFFVTYAIADGWRPPAGAGGAGGADGARGDGDDRSELDRWIGSRLQRLIAASHEAFAEFALYRLIHHLERFTDELSNWYLRRSRRRFWKADADADKLSAYRTLYDVLTALVRLLAPVLPFLTEDIYQNLVRAVDPSAPESVHLLDYPRVDEARIDAALEARIDCVLRTKNLALALRNQANIRARQPLGKLLVRPRDAADRQVLADPHFAAQVADECNVKALELIDDERHLVTVEVKANFKALGPRYGKRVQAIAAHLRDADPFAVRDAVAGAGYALDLDGERIELGAGDVDVKLHGPDHLVVAADQGAFAALDVTITPALEREGIARDFNRHAQERRRAIGLEVTDRVRVRFAASDRIADALSEHRTYLLRELLADAVDRTADVHIAGEAEAVKVGGERVSLVVERA